MAEYVTEESIQDIVDDLVELITEYKDKYCPEQLACALMNMTNFVVEASSKESQISILLQAEQMLLWMRKRYNITN